MRQGRVLIGHQGWESITEMLAGTAVYGTVRTVVWEDGGGDPTSYPIRAIKWEK